MKQYHVFVLAWTDSGVQAQVKLQLLHNAPFVDQLYNFIHSMFAKWPDNLKFVAMFGKVLFIFKSFLIVCVESRGHLERWKE